MGCGIGVTHITMDFLRASADMKGLHGRRWGMANGWGLERLMPLERNGSRAEREIESEIL